MKRQIKTAAVVAVTLALTASAAIPATACDRRGRSSRVSIGYGRVGVPVSHTPYRSYSQPVYAQPQVIRSQPVYSQPVYSQPVRTAPPAQAFNPRPVVRTNPAVAPVQQVSASVAPSVGQTNQGIAANRQVSAPANRPANRPASAPSVGQVQQTRREASAASQPTTKTAINAESSALQLLASMADTNESAAASTTQIPEFSAAATTTTTAPSGSHVGTWKVSLAGSQSVQLTLNNDSSFSWTATKNGKSNQFAGQYRLEEGRLTLVRSTDLQQMAGSWTGQDANFTFKLDGATNSGLSFSRS